MPRADVLMNATAATLETMFFSSVLGPADPSQADRISMAYRLQFHGEVRGDLTLGVSRELAIALAANFLGEDADAISEQAVGDVVCELTNMVAGCVLSTLETGSTFELTHPEAGHAEDLRQQLRRGDARAFELEDGIVAVRMQL